MTIRKTALSLLLGLFLLTIEAKSEILRWPQLCLNGTLVVKNSSNQTLRAWIQKFSDGRRYENEISVRAFGKVEFSIQSSLPDDRFSLMHFGASQKISATFNCEKTNSSSKAQSLEGGVMFYEKSDLSENKIWLQNLFSAENIVTVEYLDTFGKALSRETISLHSFEQRNFKTSLPDSQWRSLKISAEQRWTSFSMISGGARGPQSVQSQTSTAEANSAYFEVGPREGDGDTYVARISDPALIARARELVLHPEYDKIVFAKIEKGHQGFNRNFNKPEKSFWSWSVSEITNFADIGSTACNGMPQMVEDDVDLWVQNPGRICFWNYRLKREIPVQEITQEAP